MDLDHEVIHNIWIFIFFHRSITKYHMKHVFFQKNVFSQTLNICIITNVSTATFVYYKPWRRDIMWESIPYKTDMANEIEDSCLFSVYRSI